MRVTKTTTTFIVLGVFVVLLGGMYFFHDATSPQKTTVQSPTDFQFEIANTTEARTHGLSGRTEVPENYGMLFVFDFDLTPTFWMKDMFVPIDILWITKEGEIVGIEKAVEPSTYPKTFSPSAPIRYVLETRAGEAERQGWEVGTRIWLPR
jgi:uncharacterized membrane protein (UPF0127 family)